MKKAIRAAGYIIAILAATAFFPHPASSQTAPLTLTVNAAATVISFYPLVPTLFSNPASNEGFNDGPDCGRKPCQIDRLKNGILNF